MKERVTQEDLNNLSDVQIEVKKMRPGSRYASALFDEYHNVILEAHRPITDALINHLVDEKVEFLYYDPNAAREERVEEVSENVAGLDLGTMVLSLGMQNEVKETVRELMESIREIYEKSDQMGLNSSHVRKSRDMVQDMIGQVDKQKNGIFSPISIVKNLDDYNYNHSASVSILASHLASRLEYDKEIRLAMGVGGLFHDIGKSVIKRDVLNKQEQLTSEEFDFIKKHPAAGFKIVEKNPEISELEKKIVLLHHESPDKKGYPFGFDFKTYMERVPKEARLISMCDMFVAMTVQRPGRKQFSSTETLKTMLNLVYAPYKSVFRFLPDEFMEFVRSIGFSINKGGFFIKAGDMVRLNNGEVAIIEEMNKLYPLRPKVTVITDQELQKSKRQAVIDLQKDMTRYLSNVLDRNVRDA